MIQNDPGLVGRVPRIGRDMCGQGWRARQLFAPQAGLAQTSNRP